MSNEPASLPRDIRFGREICGRLGEAERREWWLANGLGGYAAGTVAGTLTRRYHGLLIAPVNPPLGRVLALAKADATLHDGERSYPLFANRWSGGAVDPHGFVDIESFHLDGRMPVWRFAFGDVAIEQRIWMEHGANTTYVAFRLEPGARPRPLRLSLALLVNARDHHAGTDPERLAPVIEPDGSRMRVRHGDWFTLNLAAQGGEITARRDWYRDFDLAGERERGLGDRDHHLCAGIATLSLGEGEWVGLAASVDGPPAATLEDALQRSLGRERAVLDRAKSTVPELASAPPWIDQLTLAADAFVIARPLPALPDGESIIAGYPWFGDWGRDTMIALPGLTLATGRFDTASRILRTFARFVDQGMLPNVFPGAGETPEYNTVDAALWYLEAWRAYVDASKDIAALRDVFPILREIVDWHVRGTRYGIGVDDADGLLHAGEPGVQITWMDAKIGDWVVTPRIGKPVEINALWFNGLSAVARLAELAGMPSAEYRALAARTERGFQRFVNPANGGLCDVIDGADGTDVSVRPNQIFAVSLPFSPLSPDAQRGVLGVVGRELLTSYGLRSLSPNDSAYSGCYEGGVWQRDSTYHQGPVWPWLLGHYALAEFRVHGDADRAQQRLFPLRDHLLDAGVGTVSEILDGAAPHTPRGCPSQAWSVACLLAAWQRLEMSRKAPVRNAAPARKRRPLVRDRLVTEGANG
jgi:predicted glycogen debranching enzyme